ncbi:MAG TPA: N-6 DNA methylase [Blastocatellia bacterium]|nr:N-6 DNA methylase [Blastocatellia bacterium]
MKPVGAPAISPSRRKAMGTHYTPSSLARFVADRLVSRDEPVSGRAIRILDPACGDGALLEAIVRSMRDSGSQCRCDVVGVEADPSVLPAVESRLEDYPTVSSRLISADFLEIVAERRGQAHLWSSAAAHPDFEQPFDIIIANPPYVRTQVLGAEKAQRLAAAFKLKGRVDLYHAFLVAATETLRPGGRIGIITSNRFLSTMGGSAIRGFLARNYEIEEVVDLGDTKLFAAAVLPAVLIARRRTQNASPNSGPQPRFIKIYSQASQGCNADDGTPRAEIMDIVSRGEPGLYRTAGGTFQLSIGDLVVGRDPTQVWSLTTDEETAWLKRMRSAAQVLFSDVAAVRVGVKTTADEVFIRSDWETLPRELQPEPALLHPLLRHEDAVQWAMPDGAQPAARILYPYEVSSGRRQPVDLTLYPKAKAYLESHRQRLESRKYVVDAGRRWYEIWVPQDPAAWAAPKIVFPDISPEPRFYLDVEGRLVDGDCYWITLRTGVPQETLYLLLALANSSLMTRFHDLAFNNKLYSSRRRYITQYVAKYPCPDPASPAAQAMISRAHQLVEQAKVGSDQTVGQVREAVENLARKAFGFDTMEVAE